MRLGLLRILFLVFLLPIFQIPPLAGVNGPETGEETGEVVLVPSGSFVMGTGPGPGKEGVDYGVDEVPRHEVYLNAFYIDRYEVTIGEFREYLKATGNLWEGGEGLPPHMVSGILETPGAEQYPIQYVTWGDAGGYCRWKGKRLPTEAEWEKAARGTDGKIWPWGNTFDAEGANTEESGIGGPAPVGSFPKDQSPFGLYDVAGNMSEWTQSSYLPYPRSPIEKDGRWSRGNYVLKGGSFLLSGRLHGRPAARSLAFPGYAHRMYGFRCARDVSK